MQSPKFSYFLARNENVRRISSQAFTQPLRVRLPNVSVRLQRFMQAS